MSEHIFNRLEKTARATVIARYLEETNQRQCVCFTCGNAGAALVKAGVNVVQVVKTNRWWRFGEIRAEYKMFDATSGHLPAPLMLECAKELQVLIEGEPKAKYAVCSAINKNEAIELPTGSGETLVVMKILYPALKLVPVYGLDESTLYHGEAPLNQLVKALAYKAT